MLDDDAGRAARGRKLGDAFIRRVGVVDVVVRELLALQLARGRDAGAALRRTVECGALMRILAVAQRLCELAAERAVRRRGLAQFIGKPVRDRGVIGGGAGIGLLGERLA